MVDSLELWNMPEFIALYNKLGIKRIPTTSSLAIYLDFNRSQNGSSPVEIRQEYYAPGSDDTTELPIAVEIKE